MLEIMAAITISILAFFLYDAVWRWFWPREAAIARLYFMAGVDKKCRENGMRYDWKKRKMRRGVRPIIKEESK